MVQEHCIGKITDISENGIVTIFAQLPNLNKALDRHYDRVEIILPDGRKITPEQRRKCYALLGEITEFVSGIRNAETLDETKSMMKWEFILHRMEAQERRLFSLANCDVSTAREFITYLVSFIVENDIPTKIPLIEQCEDIASFVYACSINRKCAVCGKDADVHHCEGSRIGAGVDRNEVHHLGREVLPLCREHHSICHNDEEAFIEKFHLVPVRLDEALCKKLKLKK
ncbi:Putative HNHc nuclease [Anaerovibrio lipolyticus DSM 3074]|uniref:Putative HNHc nuclease n=1 Tax=Anaerovibrio lipolyticus DSM 3074 TaxID=1120997 RepID=A0A1M6C5Q6_9FIRM|nr:putative HNHc nuclease [Anaerovibrio lipolyticus]SHI56084.1 Putative HNHc nuclease [Anaerovibrio lipolyticus DSM 3074]